VNAEALKVEVRKHIKAPPEAVFRAWVTPTSVKQWVSSPDAPARKAAIERKVGGRFSFECDYRGGVWVLDGRIREYDPPRRLAFTWVTTDVPAEHESVVAVDFVPKDGGTDVIVTQTGFPTEGKRQENADGWSMLLANIAPLLASQRTLRAVARKTIHAPVEAVWRAWTTPEMMRRFMSDGSAAERFEADVRPGGTFVIDMAYGGGSYHHEGEYLEVDPPRRLKFTWWSEWSPRDLNPTVTIDFIANGDSTEIVLVHEGQLDEPTRADHQAGWQGMLDNIETMAGSLSAR